MRYAGVVGDGSLDIMNAKKRSFGHISWIEARGRSWGAKA